MSDREPHVGVEVGGEIAAGKRLVRARDRGRSFAARLTGSFNRLTWRTPLPKLGLSGHYPLKLIAVPVDPVAGDADVGRAMGAGILRWQGDTMPVDAIDFSGGLSPELEAYLQEFAWLRDLAAGLTRTEAALIAERLMQRWLVRHADDVRDASGSVDRIGRRLMFWSAYAPLILSSGDAVYRSSVLHALARGARHLDRSADRAVVGLPRITAWSGVVTAGLLIPGGDVRRGIGEVGLVRALGTGISDDGGIVTRCPAEQTALVERLAMLAQVYAIRNATWPPAVQTALDGSVAALLGVAMGDGALASWQGAGPIAATRVAAVVAASGVRTRPLRHARDWGYQRLSAGRGDRMTIVIADMAPPPPGRWSRGAASTLAFELSDGDQRLIVNCGGPGGVGQTAVADDLARALRSTAACSTLTLADSNSTAINADGTLGAGVASVQIERTEHDGSSRIEASHDGYARRGFLHRRSLTLSANGAQLHGEDALLPAPRGRRRPTDGRFAIRFHVAPGVELSPTADGFAALLRIDHGPLWQFRCRGASLTIEDSLWIDGAGVPRRTQQLVVEGCAPAGGISVSWLLKRAG